MKKAVAFVAGVCLAFGVFAGGEITWTGEGETAAWSDGGNWEGGVAPGLGDTAVIPEGADVTACNADYTYMNADATKLAGIRIETNAWMTVSNLSASVTHSVPLSGPGGWRHIKTKGGGNYSVTMNADNSAFTGEFFMKEGGLGVSGSAKSLGTSNNKVTYYGNGGANRYLQYNVSDCSNEVHIYSNGGGYLYYGPNNKTTWGETYVHGTSQTWGSGSCVFDFYGGYFVDANVTVNCNNGVRFLKNGVVSLGAGAIFSSNAKYTGNYYGITIGKPVIGTGTVRDNGSWIRFTDHANCLDRTVTLELAKASSKIQMDGGYDQQCGTLSLAAAVTEETLISAAAAAKFTVRGSASRDVKCSLNGMLSFELNSDADPENPGSAKLVSGANMMSGTLSVRRGTLTLGAESQFPNAAGLEATGDGVMVVETAAVNPGVSHLVIDSADNLQLGEALTEEKPLVVYDAKVGDYYLPVGTYDESDGYFTGAGHLKVLVKPVVEVKESVWNGSQGDGDFLNPLNWDKMPDLTHGETRLVFGGTGATAEVTVPEEIHIYGITFKGEVATTISSAPGVKIWLGAGGVQSEKGTASGIVNTLNAPLHFEVLPQDAWKVATGTTLDVRQPLTDEPFDGVQQVIYGGGTIRLNVDSPDLQVPLALSNLFIKVNRSYALGSTNRATRLYITGEQLRFTCETNYVPIRLKGLGTATYFANWGINIVQAGDTICDGLDMNLSSSNYRFIGGFGGSGTFYTINYGYTIDGLPMHSSTLNLYQDGSTLNLRSRDNVYRQITQVNGQTICYVEGALSAGGAFIFGRANKGFTSGTLDLNGFDQDSKTLQNGMTAEVGDTTVFGQIASANRPAVITTHDTENRTIAMKFIGYAGYAHAGSGTYTFLNFANTATNTLSVLAGGVTLKSGAGFPNAKAVHIANGATLTVDKTSESVAFGSAGASRALMTIEAGGTLALTDGAAVTVRRLCVGEKGIEPGVYTAGDPANPWLTGSGSVRVLQPWKPGVMLIVK